MTCLTHQLFLSILTAFHSKTVIASYPLNFEVDWSHMIVYLVRWSGRACAWIVPRNYNMKLHSAPWSAYVDLNEYKWTYKGFVSAALTHRGDFHMRSHVERIPLTILPFKRSQYRGMSESTRRTNSANMSWDRPDCLNLGFSLASDHGRPIARDGSRLIFFDSGNRLLSSVCEWLN